MTHTVADQMVETLATADVERPSNATATPPIAADLSPDHNRIPTGGVNVYSGRRI